EAVPSSASITTLDHYTPVDLVASLRSLVFLVDPSQRPRRGLADGVLMTVHSFHAEIVSRGARMLRTALGPAIATWLDDPSVVEVMLNPDGQLWIDRLTTGLAETGEHLTAADGERIVRLVAHHVGAEVHPGSPRVSAELPET